MSNEKSQEERAGRLKLSGELEAIRARARDRLLFYTQVCDRNYIPGDFHRHLAGLLEQVAARKIRRLIVNVPPRHGKSRLVTVEFPTWLLANQPASKMVLASYSGGLATTHAKQSRDRLGSSAYRNLFPEIRFGRKSVAAGDWETLAGGSYKAVGVGGSLTGHGADILVIDDPHKDFEEAHSPAMREKVWDWFLSTAYTRLAPSGCIVIISTRWHVDDLVGRLLSPDRQRAMEDSGIPKEQWEIVKLPALAEDNDPLGRRIGEALFRERFPEAALLNIKEVIGSYLWAALYQQDPIIKGGNFIHPESFVEIGPEDVPADLRQFSYWDLATSENKMADYTARARGGVLKEGREVKALYITDIRRGRWEWPQARSVIKALAEEEKIMVGVEAIAGFKTSFSNLREVVSSTVPLRSFGADKDKVSRALPWIALTEARKVYIVRGPHTYDFKKECADFPAGAHDDMVDAVSGLYNMAAGFRPIALA